MSKRKASFSDDLLSKNFKSTPTKKHTLDSDEEDETEDDNVLDIETIEGEEDGVAINACQERFTAFNMKEEMEEGHFDKDGHFIWKNEKEVRDNWLDNIDWQNVQTTINPSQKQALKEESDESDGEQFQEIETYKLLLIYMQPRETLNRTISRLGKNKKLSSLERLRRKKAGLLESDNEVIYLTELANKFLSAGNMDIYEETFESIAKKIENYEKNKIDSVKPELDMYADDFEVTNNVKEQLNNGAVKLSQKLQANSPNTVLWEFKWKFEDREIQGPYESQQMLKYATEGYFKTGVWARKRNSEAEFCSTNRIDFDLYL